MLLLGHLWGNRTLIKEIKSARPATIYEYGEKGWSESRYWKPPLGKRQVDESYFQELQQRYSEAVTRTAKTLPEEAGIWLSGGLDSRTTSAVMSTAVDSEDYRLSTFSGFTYDANPPTGDNPRLAKLVATELDIEQENVELSSKTFTSNRIERIIDVCDDMVRWNTALNLSASYDVKGKTPVLMEDITGGLLGDHLLQSHFKKASNIIESHLMSEASVSPSTVSSLIVPEIDPLKTLKEEARRSKEQSLWSQILDVHFQNYYSRLAYASNTVMRDVAGSRTPSVDGRFLEWIANLPLKYRKGTLPFTTSIPTGTSRAKLDLSRRINRGVHEITYERTKVPPKYPYPLHVAGYLGNVAIGRLRSKETYGGGQLADI